MELRCVHFDLTINHISQPVGSDTVVNGRCAPQLEFLMMLLLRFECMCHECIMHLFKVCALATPLQVHSWVLWNAGDVCPALCDEMGSNARGTADVSERVLSGTLEALSRGKVAGRTDPRARYC